MEALLRESRKLELRKSLKTSVSASNNKSPRSPSSVQKRGEGIIGKVIIPSIYSETIDGVNFRREEAGQLRHVCPHTGCEKHFSTSGHARRHSRIHDPLCARSDVPTKAVIRRSPDETTARNIKKHDMKLY